MKNLLLCILITSATFLSAQTFTNPILPGGYPDPSICRVGEEYYIVNSSFEYFPGLPIHRSKDLVNWELVAYGLHRNEQCIGANNLVDVQQRGGIHAPTIRHHNGTFYIITTNVYSPKDKSQPTQFINFIITAKDIKGPWSEPHVLEGAPGIDPDIFFDDDGKVWYLGTHAPDKPNFNGEGEIWLQEIDLSNWKLTGNRHYLWRGACGGTWAEGPHVYKKDGRYYLLIAEGGTHFNHAVMIAVSDSITGPYIPNARNPILTTRHLSYDNWVHSTGHADLIELPDGRWYMVALGIRGEEQRRSNMGRETHLVPVEWEREPFEWKKVKHEWPVVAPLSGRIERLTKLPFTNQPQFRNDAYYNSFDLNELDLEWNFRRIPLENSYSLSANKGFLRLFLKPEEITLRGRSAQMGIRQKETNFEYSTKMLFQNTENNLEAGISLFQQDDNFINYMVEKSNNQYYLKLEIKERKTEKQTIKRIPLKNYKGTIFLKVISKNKKYRFSYSLDDNQKYKYFEESNSNLLLSHGYTGAYLGLYATSKGKQTGAFADFDWVRYKGFPLPK